MRPGIHGWTGFIEIIRVNKGLPNAIRQLDEPVRRQIAQVLLETEMDSNLTQLIEQLATRAPADDLSDADINAEIALVRESRPIN